MDNVFIEFVVSFMLVIGCNAIIAVAMTLPFCLHFVTIAKTTTHYIIILTIIHICKSSLDEIFNLNILVHIKI